MGDWDTTASGDGMAALAAACNKHGQAIALAASTWRLATRQDWWQLRVVMWSSLLVCSVLVFNASLWPPEIDDPVVRVPRLMLVALWLGVSPACAVSEIIQHRNRLVLLASPEGIRLERRGRLLAAAHWDSVEAVDRLGRAGPYWAANCRLKVAGWTVFLLAGPPDDELVELVAKVGKRLEAGEAPCLVHEQENVADQLAAWNTDPTEVVEAAARSALARRQAATG